MHALVPLLLWLTACLSLHAEEARAPKPDAAFFTKLRMEYAQRKEFSPYWNLAEERDEIRKMMELGNTPRVLELSQKWLEQCPVDADVHAMRSHAANAHGDAEAYVYHLYFAMGLMQSVMESGDGTTPQTAWKVISIVEEYSLLREIGAEITSRALIYEGEQPFDRMNVRMPTGEEKTFYFDVSLPMEAIKRKAADEEPDAGGKKER